jgi:uncharacterized Zn-binding protein involved in type VI secretion
MGQPAARLNDTVTGIDIHIVIVPGPPSTPTPLPHPFSGTITQNTVNTVLIAGQPAATVGSIAQNQPPHIPTPPGVSFQRPPTNQGTVETGSATVTIAGQAAARQGDSVRTCNDPTDQPVSTIVTGATTVTIG